MSTRDIADESDSSNSSWVLVNENEELAHEFNSAESDVDSDGISVISEPEEHEEVVETIVHQEVPQHNAENVSRNLFLTTSLIGAGVAVVAILIVPYLSQNAETQVDEPTFYATNDANVKLVDFKIANKDRKFRSVSKKQITNNVSERFTSQSNQIRQKSKKRDFKERHQRKNTDFVSKDKLERVKTEYKLKKKKLNVKEEYLRKKEAFLIEKEYNLKQKELEIAKKYRSFHGRIENYTISGYWHSYLHQAREKLRRKEFASNWVFERANMRSKLRNKAHWYFQWMTGREELRYKGHKHHQR